MSKFNFPFITETKELSNLRKEVRKFISEALINKEFEPAADGWVFSANPNFSKKLGTKGWLGMSFPKKYGGNEKTALERYIVTEELLASGAPVICAVAAVIGSLASIDLATAKSPISTSFGASI